jgi:hypothetical protein
LFAQITVDFVAMLSVNGFGENAVVVKVLAP